MLNKIIKYNLKNIAYIILPAIFFIIDRWLKNIALERKFSEEISLIPNIIYFKFQANENIAFSLPLSNNIALFLSLIILIILFYLIYYLKLKKITSPLVIFLLLFIALGALSNIIDRINHSFVIDYLSIPWLFVFNLADVMISLSGIIIITTILFKRK